MKPVVLVIDDEKAIRLFLEATLEDHSCEVVTAGTGAAGLASAEERAPDLVLLDLMLPDMSGLQVLAELKERLPHLCVIMLTGYREADTAVKAMKLEAYDYVTKPIQVDRLLKVVSGALEHSAEARARYRQTTRDDLFEGDGEIVPSRSPRMLAIYDTIRRISAGESTTVLIEGESGVGKDVIAGLIHRSSLRREYPFLEINCAALPEQLLESELFGHEKGAFTDAVAQKLGLLELANNGTLFLDEIGEMAPQIQVKLLRVLEKMSFRRVGGLQDIAVNVRIVAATNRNLAEEVRRGAFREDLFFRLNVVRLEVPPLRERPEDILPLARHYLDVFNERFGRTFKGLTTDAEKAFLAYPWPGNIREMRNVMERTALLADGPWLDAARFGLGSEVADDGGLPERLGAALAEALPEDGVDLEGLVAEFEEAMVRKAMAASGGNQSGAARLLGLNRDKLRHRLKTFGIGKRGAP